MPICRYACNYLLRPGIPFFLSLEVSTQLPPLHNRAAIWPVAIQLVDDRPSVPRPSALSSALQIDDEHAAVARFEVGGEIVFAHQILDGWLNLGDVVD